MSARVTVIIATYRPEGAILPLRGLMGQTFKNFDVVLVTEIGAAAWGGKSNAPAAHSELLRVINAPVTQYHSPTHALNLGIDAVDHLGTVALLADFAYPDPSWLAGLLAALATGSPFVGGLKCAHGTADSRTVHPPVGPCSAHPIIPVGFAAETAVVYPSQAAFTLGNCAFRRVDALAVNGLEERFAGGHGHEDENFVRRLVAYSKLQALITRHAVIHHYWPYAAGYKPVVAPTGRKWASHFPLNWQLDKLLVDSETLVGNYRAQRVPIVDVPATELVERIPAASYEDP